MEKKKEEKKAEFDKKNGVTLTWDNAGNCFVSMGVTSIPKKQFEDWMRKCKSDFSGKRWDMIFSDHLKANAYELMMVSQAEIPEDNEENINPLGLMNGGQ